ncbi:MAG: S49 family peptidase [Chloroflexota bacterium]
MPNWNDVLKETADYVKEHKLNPQQAGQAIDTVRRKYLNLLHENTKRNVIAYYSGFLSKPEVSGLDINDEDKNGFMMAVHHMDRSKGLDLLLHTPGGGIGATQSIVNYLRKMFGNDIRAIVPQIAMSAGTMVACSCRVIVMGTHSNIGPIDPQLRGVPCYGVIEEFRRAYREVKRDPTKALLWQTIIGQYRPTFLSQCENSIRWSNAFVKEQLESVMFAGEPDAKEKASQIVKLLTNYRGNKSHDRHIHAEDCEAMNLKIESLEAPGNEILQDLVLTVHHCYMHLLMNTGAYKVVENHMGTAFMKQIAIQQFMIPQQPQRIP